MNMPIYYKIHKLRIKSDFDIQISSCFRTGRMSDCDLVVKLGEANYKNLNPVAPPYLFFGKDKLVHNYGFPIPCNFSIENLEGKTKITVTDLYRRLPNIDVSEIISYAIELKLLQRGLVKIHAAGVKFKKNGIMIVGWDGCGKSTIALDFLRRGAGFLSDDTVIIDENYAYSYPKSIKVFQGLSSITKNLNNIPYLNKFIGNYRRVAPKNIVGRTKVNYIFVSRYGEKKIRKLSNEEAFKTLITLAIYRAKRRDIKNLVLAYCHYNKYDIDRLLEKRRAIIKSFLKGVKVYEILSKNPREAIDIINKTIE